LEDLLGELLGALYSRMLENFRMRTSEISSSTQFDEYRGGGGNVVRKEMGPHPGKCHPDGRGCREPAGLTCVMRLRGPINTPRIRDRGRTVATM
jgi:hypothetical protein